MKLRFAFFIVTLLCCATIYSQDKKVRIVSGNMGITLLVIDNDTLSYRVSLYSGIDSARKEARENELTVHTQMWVTTDPTEDFKMMRDTVARMPLSDQDEWNKFFSKMVLFQIMPYIPPHKMLGEQIAVKLTTPKATVLFNIISKDGSQLNLLLDYLSNDVFQGKRKDIFEKIKSMIH